MADSGVTSLAESPVLNPAFCHSVTVSRVTLVGPGGSVSLLGVAGLGPHAEEEEEGPGNGDRVTSGAPIVPLQFCFMLWTEAWVGMNSLFPSLVLRLGDSVWPPSTGTTG